MKKKIGNSKSIKKYEEGGPFQKKPSTSKADQAKSAARKVESDKALYNLNNTFPKNYFGSDTTKIVPKSKMGGTVKKSSKKK